MKELPAVSGPGCTIINWYQYLYYGFFGIYYPPYKIREILTRKKESEE